MNLRSALHPANIVGLTAVMHDLVADGNSVLLVDHDTQVLSEADWIVEMGPGAGADGGHILAQGTVPALAANGRSLIGPFLGPGAQKERLRPAVAREQMFALGTIRLATAALHTVKPLEVRIPKGRLTVVTGVSGSGKTTLILESLIPALEAATRGAKLPEHVRAVDAPGIGRVKLIDATPIGINVRSTVATYANVHDELRKVFARTPDARQAGCKAGDFSYNTGRLRCPVCDGTGVISLDVQFLPDVEIPCPECRGSRYDKQAGRICYRSRDGRALHAAAADGNGRTYGVGRLPRLEGRNAAAASTAKPGARLSDPGRSHAELIRRRGAAAETGKRDGPWTGRHRLYIRRADDRPAPRSTCARCSAFSRR